MSKLESEKEMRKVMINSPQKHNFPTNSIKTAKYNIFTFLPLAIVYQFTNYFNIFFLIASILMGIKALSSMDPGVAIAPFMIIIGISVVIEGIEDLKKAKFDKKFNNSITLRVNYETNEEQEEKWSQIKVGEVIKIKKNEVIPADVLILKTSLSNGFCYMETTNLDGESSLKPREALYLFTSFFNEEVVFKNLEGIIEVDQPNSNIYNLNGTVKLFKNNKGEILNRINSQIIPLQSQQPSVPPSVPSNPSQLISQNSNFQQAFFTIEHTLLRGATLKNVDYVYGIVLYTGVDTKIMKNIRSFSLKSSSIEKTMNKVIIAIIIFVFSICVVCTMFGMIFLSENVRKAQYIFYDKSENYPYTSDFFQLFGAFFIIFNNVIPISLSITFIIAKGIQVYIMGRDKQMWNEEEGEQFKIISLRLQEDLGNVKYLFTDKTGTLTRNEMIFRACSIYSKLFFDAANVDENDLEKLENENKENSEKFKKKSIFSKLFNMDDIVYAMNSDLPIELDDIEDSYYKSSRDVIIEFFLNIALNNNVLTEWLEEDAKDGEGVPATAENNIVREKKLIYQGTSPDEVALVTAAQELGIEFLKREGKYATVRIDGHEIVYEILHKFEFSSERARSSVIVRDPLTQEIKLFIKGADDKIFQLLDEFSQSNLESTTKEHLEKFAKTGLRTLCYAVKVIPEDKYISWEAKYSQIKYFALSDKTKLAELEKEIYNIEKNCILLGVSGLEDKLQDDVKETIQEFLDAGIQVWMLTGDKLDTAESIGHSSKLFDEDTEVFKIRNACHKEEILANLNKIYEDMLTMEQQLYVTKLERKKRKKKRERISKTNNVEIEMKTNNKVRASSFIHFPNTVYQNERDVDNQNIQDMEIRGEQVEISSNQKNESVPPCDNGGVESKTLKSSPELRFKSLTKQKNFRNIRSKFYTTKFAEVRNVKNLSDIGKADNFEESRKINYTINDKSNKDKSNNSNFVGSDHSSQVDDVSVFKFMVDRNYFDSSVIKRADFAHTFMNRIMQLAASNLSGSDAKDKELIKQEIEKEIKNMSGLKSEELKAEVDKIKVLKLTPDEKSQILEAEMIGAEKRETPKGVEEIDISNLYEYYQNELKKMEQRKNSVRKILKFTNLGFPNYRKKKNKEEEEDEVKEINLHNFGIIIEGNAISLCLDNECKEIFWKIIKKSTSIICCRCNPIQKSDVVDFVKNKSGEVCLSIGDGGNDVNMIKTANVGVGIFGKEGYQAAYSSDYAISQFKYLKRLLFYHGRYSLLRNSYFIYFFFYKSLIFNIPNFWFAFFSGFSGTLIWDQLYFICYTSILSTVPPVVIMVFEEDIDITFEGDPNKEILINLIPDIYKYFRNSSPFNSLKFFIVFLLGILHSAVLYFIPLFVFKYGIQDESGRSVTFWDQSLLGVLIVMIVQYYIIFQDTFLYSTPVIITHSIQILTNVLFFALYAVLGKGQLGAYTFDIISNFQFWFTLIIVLAIDLLFVIISRKIDIHLSDNIINNLRNRNYLSDYTKKIYIKKLEHMSKCTKSLVKFKKIYQSIDNYEAKTYADRKMKEIVELYRKNKKSERFSRLNMEDIDNNRTDEPIESDNNTGGKNSPLRLKAKTLNYENEIRDKLRTLELIRIKQRHSNGRLGNNLRLNKEGEDNGCGLGYNDVLEAETFNPNEIETYRPNLTHMEVRPQVVFPLTMDQEVNIIEDIGMKVMQFPDNEESVIIKGTEEDRWDYNGEDNKEDTGKSQSKNVSISDSSNLTVKIEPNINLNKYLNIDQHINN